MAAAQKPYVYTVTQVNHHISSMFQADRALGAILVKGELSNVKYASSGHLFFTLKDDASQIRCAMWASDARRMKERIKDGEAVTVFGQISVYERDGTYQLYARAIRRDNSTGALYERYEALKKKLLEMGMFDEQYKKPIPKYIKTLGVVTAMTGAAVRDIINVSKRRSPGIQIILYPATVQGDGAAQTIVRGIETLDAMGIADVIIVGRGGGSIEDLWAFNEESVAWAVWNCSTPIISAVGHETDTTITDFVADLRAPTPSAAAELAVTDMSSALQSLQERGARLSGLMNQSIMRFRQRSTQYSFMLRLNGPEERLRRSEQFLLSAAERMDTAMSVRVREISALPARYRELLDIRMADCVKRACHRLELYESKLNALSPMAKISAGYAYIEDAGHRAVRSVSEVKKGDTLRIRLRDGSITAVAGEVKPVQDSDPQSRHTWKRNGP